MREVSFWLDDHCPPGELGVFKSAAELQIACESDTVIAVSSGVELVRQVSQLEQRSTDKIVIAGHGGTTWLLNSRHGVTTAAESATHRGQSAVRDLALAMAPVLDGPSPLISLAACMCSRSPTWLLRRQWGANIGSDWGQRAYLPGGQGSFSARLRDWLSYYGVHARVRGHRAAGHATALALLAEHRATVSAPAGTPCETLFHRALGVVGIEPGLQARRWWVRRVTGRLAERWLLGDDRVEVEIRALWREDHPTA